MGIREILEISAAILASLGGGSVIIFGFSSWLGKIWANRLMAKDKAEYARELESLRNQLTKDTESYKIKLKKSEFIFQKEYEAASEFVALKWSFLPTYSHPQMDWHEACDEIAQDFHKIEKSLSVYISKHGSVLTDEVQNHIGNIIAKAGEYKFEITEHGVEEVANKAADELFGDDGEINKAEELLVKQVHSQSST